MAATGNKKLTVVISQQQGKNPVKRQLEEELAMQCLLDSDVEVSIVPNLYDLSHDHSGMLFLKNIPGDLIILSWLYPRASRWILDRAGVKGKAGTVLLTSEEEEDESPAETGIGPLDVPDRYLYCIDLKAASDDQSFLTEIRRIAAETRTETFDLMNWIQGEPRKEQLERYLDPQKIFSAEAETGVHSENTPAEK